MRLIRPSAIAGAVGDADDAALTRLAVTRLSLTNFRNYAHAVIETGPEPVVLLGANGAGKTNLLEAVSLLAPGQGLRRAPYPELARKGGDGGWAVAARVVTRDGPRDIGTGQQAGGTPGGEREADEERRAARIVRIDGTTQSGSGVLADHVEMLWLIPAMDGLFTGAASERRRFLDRLVLCFDPSYRTRIGHFERAMRNRNRLLEDGVRDAARLSAFETVMAETGVAIAAARAEARARLAAAIGERRLRDPASPFPWADVALEGTLETLIATRPAIEVEDAYLALLAGGRERDRAAGRTLEGPHRADLVVGHGPKGMPARQSSTGEQKALLVGLVLAHAELLARRPEGAVPILLLDEIAAHLDTARRAALFGEIVRLGAQAWMTGTDRQAFEPLAGKARFVLVDEGRTTL